MRGSVAGARTTEDDMEDLAARLGCMILKGLTTRSRWALRTALDAHDADGVAGICAMRIPSKDKDYIDVTFTVGTVDIVSRWGDTA